MMEPLIDFLLQEEFLEPIDLYFARMHEANSLAETVCLAAVMQSTRNGHLCLNLREIIFPFPQYEKLWKQLVVEGSLLIKDSPYLVFHDNLIYLQKNYWYETEVIAKLKLLMKDNALEPQAADLFPEQQTAFNLVRQQNISIIEGGPGTGKTYLIKELVKSFGNDAVVILTAPTGKAVSRLRENNSHCILGTLHHLLEIKPFQNLFQETPFLEADLIVVDEASMLDVKILWFFLKSLLPHQRVVFLGDGNQLPPVEPGALFIDLIDLIPTAHLKTCRRSDRKDVLELAHSVLSGNFFQKIEEISWGHIIQFMLDHPEEGMILTPLKIGPWGTTELNHKIHAHLGQNCPAKRKVPIMITRNHPESGLANGDVGVLFMEDEKPQYAEFILGNAVKQFPCENLPSYEFAYALSVHKSQGSEFSHVLVLVPPGSQNFGRQMLYTAVTRAKKSVKILGSTKVFQETLSVSSRRCSGLKKRWNEA